MLGAEGWPWPVGMTNAPPRPADMLATLPLVGEKKSKIAYVVAEPAVKGVCCGALRVKSLDKRGF